MKRQKEEGMKEAGTATVIADDGRFESYFRRMDIPYPLHYLGLILLQCFFFFLMGDLFCLFFESNFANIASFFFFLNGELLPYRLNLEEW